MKLLLLLALPLSAQVQVSLSVVPNAAAKRLLNSRASKTCSPWVGTARNLGAERVLLSESAVIGQIVRLQPYGQRAMALLIADAAKYSLLARLARGGEDLTAAGAFIATGRKLVAPWPEVLAGVAWGAPYFVSRVRGVERPVAQSYAALAAGWPITIEAGQTSDEFYIFTARQADNAPPVVFVLSPGSVAVRMVQ